MVFQTPTTASFPPYVMEVTANISSGGTASDIFPTNGNPIVGIRLPAAWTAATIGLEFGTDATTTTMQPVISDEDGTLKTFTITTGQHVEIPFVGYSARYMRLISGNTTTSVAQGGDRVITVVLRYF